MAQKLSDFFKGIQPTQFGFSPITQTLPYGGGTYSSVVPSQNAIQALLGQPIGMSKVPTSPPPVIQNSSPVVSRPQVTPVQSQSPVPAPTPAVPNYYVNPATGQPYSAQEIVNNLAQKLPISSPPTGDLPGYAGNQMMQGPQTEQQIIGTVTDLNNARNDIATGTIDPYKINNSGIVYSPEQLQAIRSAYAGIYDPALKEVFGKLDAKQKEDAAALASKNKLSEMAQQFQYDLALKNAGTGTSLSSGVYVQGENPAVDAWTQRIYDQQAKITDIPASQKGMRDAVVLALQSSGNQLSGKPTTTELGKAALVNAKALMAKLDAGTGTGAVGGSRLWTGGALTSNIPGTNQFGFTNDFNAIKSQLSLDAVKYLKGQGQVSDAERALLAQAATKLNLSQSQGEFKTTLQSIIDKLESGNVDTSVAAVGGGGKVLTNPNDPTQFVNVEDLTAAELAEAEAAGWK